MFCFNTLFQASVPPLVIFKVHLLPSSTGLLFLSAPLDYETQRFHRLTIRAVDHGLPSLSSTQTLTMEVGDVNDQPPVFSQSIYNASVAENRDPGEPVFRVSATDEDSGNNQVFISCFWFDYALVSWCYYIKVKMGKRLSVNCLTHIVNLELRRTIIFVP